MDTPVVVALTLTRFVSVSTTRRVIAVSDACHSTMTKPGAMVSLPMDSPAVCVSAMAMPLAATTTPLWILSLTAMSRGAGGSVTTARTTLVG